MTRTLLPFVFLTQLCACVGVPRDLLHGCQANDQCDPGEVCQAGACERLCNSNRDCPATQVCLGGTCGERADGGAAPRIISVTGNGSAPERVRDTLWVDGERLQGAEFRLEGAAILPLTPRPGGGDARQELELPVGVDKGPYVLTATNQSGTAEQPISLLAEPRTAAELLDMLTTIDGSGSSLDADLLDGIHASDFAAANHSHGDYALVSHVHADYAAIDHAHAGMVVSGSDPSFDALSATSLTLTQRPVITNRPSRVLVYGAGAAVKRQWDDTGSGNKTPCAGVVNFRVGCVVDYTVDPRSTVHIPLPAIPDGAVITRWGMHFGSSNGGGDSSWTCDLWSPTTGASGTGSLGQVGTITFNVNAAGEWTRYVEQTGLSVAVANSSNTPGSWQVMCVQSADAGTVLFHNVTITYTEP